MPVSDRRALVCTLAGSGCRCSRLGQPDRDSEASLSSAVRVPPAGAGTEAGARERAGFAGPGAASCPVVAPAKPRHCQWRLSVTAASRPRAGGPPGRGRATQLGTPSPTRSPSRKLNTARDSESERTVVERALGCIAKCSH
jgi:hypothetical protein